MWREQEAWGPCGLLALLRVSLAELFLQGPLQGSARPAPPVLRAALAVSGSERQSLLTPGSLKGQEGPVLWALRLGGALRFWRWPQGV